MEIENRTSVGRNIRMNRGMNHTVTLWLSACLATLTCGTGSDSAIQRVDVLKVSKSVLRDTLRYIGEIDGIDDTIMKAGLSGKIRTVNVSEGDIVQPNQVLLTLDITTPRRDAKEAKKNLDDARFHLKVTEKARHFGHATQDSIHAARRELDAADLAYRKAILNIKNTTLKAPFTGYIRVVDSVYTPGDSLFRGTPVCSIEKIDSVRLDIPLKKFQTHLITVHTPVGISALSDSLSFQARAKIDTVISDTATVVWVNSDMLRFLPRMNAVVSIPYRSCQKCISVPETALFLHDGTPFVLVIKRKKIERRYVTPGRKFSLRTEIVSGLKRGEKVVLSLPSSIDTTQKVTPVVIGKTGSYHTGVR
jgi:membrane fusion protein (multidrug efflux system)